MDLTKEHRVSGSGSTVAAEVARVEAAGGWIADGRVCDVIAVSRAFGDREFKGDGVPAMLERGVRCMTFTQCAVAPPACKSTTFFSNLMGKLLGSADATYHPDPGYDSMVFAQRYISLICVCFPGKYIS